MQKLILQGASPDSTTRFGSTALYIAAAAGYASVVRVLISAGNCVNLAQQPPLQFLSSFMLMYVLIDAIVHRTLGIEFKVHCAQ